MAIKPKTNLSPILPIQSVPEVSKIEQIKPVQAVQPIYGFNSIQAQKDTYYRNQEQVKTFLSNYNDPTELNSFIDALTNQEAVSKRFGDTWGGVSTAAGKVSIAAWIGAILTEIVGAIASPFTGGASVAAAQAIAAPLAKVGTVAALPAIPAALDVFVEKTAKPLLAGKPVESLLNSMMNIGETADIFSNPIKGLIHEGGEGFIKGFGWSNEGRTNYDYNTGFFLSDMLLEYISDPMNWLTLGTWSAGKAVAKSTGSVIAKPIAQETVKAVNGTLAKTVGEISIEGMQNIEKGFTKTVSQIAQQLSQLDTASLSKKAMQELMSDVHTQMKSSLSSLIRRELPKATSKQIDDIIMSAGKSIKNGQLAKGIFGTIQDIQLDQLATSTLKGIQGIRSTAGQFDKFISKSAALSSGYGEAMDLLKKRVGKPLQEWAMNKVINRLKKPRLFLQNSGVNIKQYLQAKNAWINMGEYVSAIIGEQVTCDEASFRTYITNQFSRDQQLIDGIRDKYKLKPIEQIAALDSQFQTLYGCTFEEYTELVSEISGMEHNMFSEYATRLQSTLDTIPKQSFAQRMGEKIKTGAQLLHAQNSEAYTKKTLNTLENFSRVIKANNTVNFNEKIYTIQLNKARVNELLLNDELLHQIFSEGAGPTGIGAFLDNLISDTNSTAGDILAKYPQAERRLKEICISYMNMDQLYENAAGVILPIIDGVDNDKLRSAFIDIIFGSDQKTVTELLANFDDITMTDAMGRLKEMFLVNKNISEKDMMTIQLQFSQVFKAYLEAQRSAGVERVSSAIARDFTSTVATVLEGAPGLRDELAGLAAASKRVGELMSQVSMTNSELIDHYVTNAKTIFDITNIRELSDAGLALRAIDIESIKDVFETTGLEVPASVALRMENLGKAIVGLRKSFAQYEVYFDDAKKDLIDNVYMNFRKQFIDNPDGVLPESVFMYLKNTEDAVERFTQLVEFSKAIGDDKQMQHQWTTLFAMNGQSGYELLRNVNNPNALLKTDFAFNAMAQATWIAESQLNETLINGITAYQNLGLASMKICHDFKKMREVLTTNKLDRPKLLQNERYIRAAEKVNNTLQYLKEHYDKLFDRELADKQINSLYDMLERHAGRFEKYRGLVEELDAYWNGTKTFRQDKKAYVKVGKLPDGTPAIDEFTPWWNKIKEMNKTYVEIQRSEAAPETIRRYFKSERLYNELFKTNPEQGKVLLDILNNSKHTLTDEDYILYKRFIDQLDYIKTPILDTAGKNELFEQIPWEFIPAPIKELDFKYYYEILGIDDPRLAYALASEQALGWYTPGTNKITASLPKIASAYQEYTFKELAQTYRHESGHNILRRVFPDSNQRLGYLQEFKDKYIQRFGQDNFDQMIYGLGLMGYASHYNIPLERFQNGFRDVTLDELDKYELILEELHSAALGNQLDQVFPLGELEDFPAYEQFSGELTNQLAQLAEDNGLRKQAYDEFYKSKQTFNFNQDYNIVTPWDPVKKQQALNKKISQATAANARATLYKLFKLTPDELTEELAFRKRLITFNADDINDATIGKQFKNFRNNTKLISDTKELTHYNYDNKYHIFYDKMRQRNWIILDPSQQVNVDGRTVYLNGNKLTRRANPKTFEEFQIVDAEINDPNNPGITRMLNDLDNSLYELTGTHLGDSQGESFDKDTFEKIFALEDGKPKNMPQEVWDMIPKDTEGNLAYDLFAGKDMYHFNESILGTAASKAQLGMYGNNAIRNASYAITQAQSYIKPKNEYVNMVFDSSLSINSPNSIWKDFTDEEIMEALQRNGDYHLVTLVDDKKWGVKTRDIPPISVDAIKKARELGAVIIPTQVYKDMYNTVNHRLGSTGAAKLWSRIMYTYKAGYLLRPGAWIRNFIDTNIKSMLHMGDEFFTYKNLAHKILDDVHNIKDYIQARSDEGIIYKDAIDRFFGRTIDESTGQYYTNLSNFLTYEQFMELNEDFFSQKVSGNIMADIFNPGGGEIWDSFTHITGKIIDMANATEEYNRLAVYLYNLDRGMDYTSALNSLAKTHFDYGFKTKAEQLADMIFPFTTFSMRNYSYWVEQLDKHPWLLRNYVHLMKPSWDFQDYTPEELARDRRVQTQIVYGQLKLAEFNDKVLTFKANPSIQDAIQMFNDPINNVYDKLAAPIATPLEILQGQKPNLTNLIPIAGQAIQSTQTAIKTGSPLPSAIGIQPKPKQTGKAVRIRFSNPNLSGTDKYTDNTYRTPKYRKNVIYNAYATKGISRYRLNMYPIVDIAHDIKMRYSVDVYNRIKNRVHKDVYNGIRYRIRLDTNKFR